MKKIILLIPIIFLFCAESQDSHEIRFLIFGDCPAINISYGIMDTYDDDIHNEINYFDLDENIQFRKSYSITMDDNFKIYLNISKLTNDNTFINSEIYIDDKLILSESNNDPYGEINIYYNY